MSDNKEYDPIKAWGERQKKYADEKKQAGEKLLSLIKDKFGEEIYSIYEKEKILKYSTPECYDSIGYAFYIAAKNNHKEICEWLLEYAPSAYKLITSVLNSSRKVATRNNHHELSKWIENKYETIYNKRSYVLSLRIDDEIDDESESIETSVYYGRINQIKAVYPYEKCYEECYIDVDPSNENLDDEILDKLIENINITEILPKIIRASRIPYCCYYIIFVQKTS